jgi:signal transduction histidine kinase
MALPLERQVLDALPISIHAMDLDGRITFLNRSSHVASSTGAPSLWDRGAAVGASVWDAIVEPAARAQVRQAMATLRESGTMSLSWEQPCGSRPNQRIFLVRISALAESGAVAGFVMATQDVTELVDRVARKRRLDAIGEVSTGVAHELRNPLFGISSAAQLLRFRVKDDPVVEKNVGRILREVERLNAMSAALLEYGQSAPVRLTAGDPDAVWADVLEHQRGLLESRALLVQWTRAEPAARCAIDASQLAQVLTNLLANASDAAPEGTDLTLDSTVLPNGAWRCRLRNAGTPIPPDVLPRVFEIFFSTKPAGAGIGLALCQRIVEEHGGTLALDSAAESGTVATIVLPSAAQAMST